MYRAFNPSSQTRSHLLAISKRRLTTEASPPKPRFLRKLVWATATATGVFYVGGTFVAFNNKQAYDFFSQNVPLGPTMLQYGEAHNWDTLTPQDVLDSTTDAVYYVKRLVTDGINGAPKSTQEAREMAAKKTKDVQVSAAQAYKDSKKRLEQVAQNMHTKVEEVQGKVVEQGEKAAAVTKHQAIQFSEGVEELIKKAEEAIKEQAKEIKETAVAAALSTEKSAEVAAPDDLPNLQNEVTASPADDHLYVKPLPIGFELPPGWHESKSKSPASKPKADLPSLPHLDQSAAPAPPPEPLPSLASSLSPSITASEPVIAHLASTIDSLTAYVAQSSSSNPTSTAASAQAAILVAAQTDLTQLADRIESIKEAERAKLEESLDEQTREYTVKLLEMEMAAQDRMDSQEGDFRRFFEGERERMVDEYRERLEGELRTQSDIINERLKGEVIAQGIELQRRWIREIKVRVERERGGRLAKLDELATALKKLERLTVDNSAYLDENIRVHAFWTALRALVAGTLDGAVRRPFREELRVLRTVAGAEGTLVRAVLAPLEESDGPDVGIEPLGDLTTWFTSSVVPRVSAVALVPATPSSSSAPGLLSHLASHFLSSFRFKREGMVEGDDVLSVLARAEAYLGEKDLDRAAREVNQLGGTAKVLVQDWLEAVRRRLEVVQAVEAIQAQAQLASLLVL